MIWYTYLIVGKCAHNLRSHIFQCELERLWLCDKSMHPSLDFVVHDSMIVSIGYLGEVAVGELSLTCPEV